TNVPIDTGLEITFSHENFQVDGVEEYFSISPQVEGRFEKHKKTLVFISDGLKQGTIYTVTLKKGMPLVDSTETLGGEYSFSFETKPIQDKVHEKYFEIDSNMIEFKTSEAPVYPVYYPDIVGDSDLCTATVVLYSYSDYKVFIEAQKKKSEVPEWSYNARRIYKEDLSTLKKVGEFNSDFLNMDYYQQFLIFPENLPAGYYTAEVKINDAVRQIWFQITDLAVYQAQGREKSLFWVNDLESKKPANGVSLIIEGGNLSFKGDDQGVISVDKNIGTKEIVGIQERGYVLIKNSRKEIVVPLETANNTNASKEPDYRDYWKYLYLDRELFKPGDTVNYWGILSPRKGALEINELEVEIRGTGGNYSYGWGEKAPIISQKASVNNKVFTGSIELPILSPGYYYIEVKKGNTVLLSRGFSVENYQKPAYKISVEPEKKAIFAGENVNFYAKASFFEGTPVNNIKLDYNISGQRSTVVTNEKGTATISYTVPRSVGFDPYRHVYLGVNAAFPEAGEISTSSSIWVFPSKVYIEGKMTSEGDEFTLDAKLSKIDLSKINEGEVPYDEKNFVSGPANDCLIKCSIYQDIWEKVEIGNEYNFITKKVEKSYHYNHSTKHIEDFEIVTDVDGRAVYKGVLDKENSYYVVLTAQDREGREIREKMYIPNNNQMYNPDYGRLNMGNTYYHLEFAKGRESFATGENVSLILKENDKNLPTRNQGYLFYRGQKEIETYSVLNQSEYSFTFKEKDVPNVNVLAVYFDGFKYNKVNSCLISFDKEQKALKINIKTDKAEYRPKDEVKLEVLVTDKNDKPVKAKVNLNLVDEALYNMRDQNVDFISNLYGDYLYLFTSTRVSHKKPAYHCGAECGGEGESERKDFSDTVIFRTVETDSNGKATTEFTLPDNLTSWRVTYHGVTQDLQAAS
ncbi:MAG: alpha-2-macroglobulin family protein, partial [Clostridia bacterium]|nr:alpha-2-macroglobulin family protein [Clostridia bacterium]